jgi:hypothetical protein
MSKSCVHFNGIQHSTCKAGVEYASVRDESTRPYGFPCLTAYAGAATCEKRQLQTLEEELAEEADYEAAFKRVDACMKAIREKHGKARGLVADMPCPTGCGGTLRYSIAGYNGHIHGQCSTDGCARWMQ